MIRVAVGILRKQEKVLVGQRPANKPYAGYWEFPGGKIEENETAEDALSRELREELGIDVISARAFFSHLHHYPDKTVLLELWLVEKFSGEPHAKEQQILRWVAFPELIELKLLEGNIAIIDQIKSLPPVG